MRNFTSRQFGSKWSLLACSLLCATGTVLAGPVPRNECATPPPGTIFCEDFEGANPKANFDDFDGNLDTENLVVTDFGPAVNVANKAIRLRVPAGQRGTSDLLKVLPNSYDKLYARWYLKYETGFNFGAPHHGSGLAAGDRSFVGQSGNRPSGNDFAGFYVQHLENTAKPYTYSYYTGMYQQCGSPGNCFGDSLPCVYDAGANFCTKVQHRPVAPLPTFVSGQWYCIEQLVDMGTPTASVVGANGRLALWVDGQSLGDFQDLWIRTSAALKLKSMWLNLFHHDGTHSIVGQLIDNVVVSTQRVGCGTSARQSIPPMLMYMLE